MNNQKTLKNNNEDL